MRGIRTDSIEWLNRAKELKIENRKTFEVCRYTLLYIALMIFSKRNGLAGKTISREGKHQYHEILSSNFITNCGPEIKILLKKEYSMYSNAILDAIQMGDVKSNEPISGNPINVKVTKEDLETHLDFLRILRNNLFHAGSGGKEQMDPRDEQLLNAGSRIILGLFDEVFFRENRYSSVSSE